VLGPVLEIRWSGRSQSLMMSQGSLILTRPIPLVLLIIARCCWRCRCSGA
jgi:hypothetical protein